MPEDNDREARHAQPIEVLDAMLEHSSALTKLTLELAETARVAREKDEADAWAKAHKDALTHFYGEAQKYTTAIIAGGYAAYFTALSILSGRFTDKELSIATLSITVSLTIFVLHEIFNVGTTAFRAIRGKLEQTSNDTAINVIWGVAYFASILTALPAMAVLIYVCIKHLL